MTTTVIALSGPVGSGKSSLAVRLQRNLKARHVKTNVLIEALCPDIKRARRELQEAGDRLDLETDGSWVGRQLYLMLEREPQDSVKYVVLDAVRIAQQLVHLRRFFQSVVHIHLTADDVALRERYAQRPPKIEEVPTYDAVRENLTEKNIETLASLADAVIDTVQCTEEDIFSRVVARLGKRPSIAPACVDVLVGGQYGSEGKGNIAAYLAREYDVLVRVGGPNAGHKVFRRDQRPFTFQHIPSGALSNPAAKLVIGAGAVLRPKKLLEEIAALSLDITRLLIDGQAMVIEESDVEWEQNNLKGEISSTAQGVGMATARKVLRRPQGTDVRLARDLPELKHLVGDTVTYLSDAICEGSRIFLEGTQGTSLGIHHGFYPHVTSRVTSASGCIAEAGLAPRHVRRVIMVCRTYPIRVGNSSTGKTSGPMSREISLEVVSKRSGIDLAILREIEKGSVSGTPRRIGEFDWDQFRKSALLNGPTDIALTFADYLGIANKKAFRYEQLTPETLRFIEELEKVGGVPVSLISTDFSERNIIDRRAWE